jgi:hypothetical protein
MDPSSSSWLSTYMAHRLSGTARIGVGQRVPWCGPKHAQWTFERPFPPLCAFLRARARFSQYPRIAMMGSS